MAEANGTRACVVCGVLFPRNGKQTLCSAACKIERGKAQAKEKRAMLTPIMVCKHCAKEFRAPANKLYCGRKCKSIARAASAADKERKRKWSKSPAGQAWALSCRERHAAAKREHRKKFKRNRKGESAKRRAKAGIPPRDWTALALKSVASICEISTQKQRRIRACVRRADRLKSRAAIRGQSEYTRNLKANPKAYAVCLTRWRAKSFKRKTGRDMPDDGTVTAACLIGKCIYCDARLTGSNRSMDHMHPLVLGGVHSAANVAPCCITCNLSKGWKLFLDFVATLSVKNRLRAVAYFEKRNGPAQQIQLGLAA